MGNFIPPLTLLSIGVANATDDGIYEYGGIRSPVISSSSDIVITPENFSGFWYDIDDNIGSETLTIYDIYGRTIEEDFLAYRSSIMQAEYEADFVYFESQTPGFSPFAIGSEAEVVEIADESSLESVDDENVEGTTVEDKENEPESSSMIGILVALGGISVLLIGAFVVYKKRS